MRITSRQVRWRISIYTHIRRWKIISSTTQRFWFLSTRNSTKTKRWYFNHSLFLSFRSYYCRQTSMHCDIDLFDKIQLMCVQMKTVTASKHYCIQNFSLLYVGNSCSFISCENNGLCFEDSTTIDCFRCQCAPGYTGKICDTPMPVIRMHRFFLLVPANFCFPIHFSRRM